MVLKTTHRATSIVFGVGIGVALAACPRGGARGPAAPPLDGWHAVIEPPGAAGVGAVALAADGRAAVTTATGVAAFDAAGRPTWVAPLPAAPRAVAFAGDQVVVAVAGSGGYELGGPITLRGEPAAAIAGIAASGGAPTWARPLGSTEWVVVRALAAAPDGDVLAAGSFGGTLRVGDEVATAAGPSDGFVVRLDPAGAVRWLVRVGGERADAVAAIAAAPRAGDGLVIGGSYQGDADLRGVPLAPIERGSIYGDAFVARLDDAGAVRWARGFGGDHDDAVAGVAIAGRGLVGAAATLRGDALIDGKVVSTRGLADAAVVTFDGDGRRRAVALIGGGDYDSAAGLAAIGDDLVVAASYSGTVILGAARLSAAGGDGALLAVLDPSGEAVRVVDVAGPGRETIVGLAGVPGGFAAAVRHTAGAELGGIALPAPAEPTGGAALVVSAP